MFNDVMPAIKRYHKMGIKIGIYTTLNQDTTRLVLSSTTDGNVAAELDYFFDHETIGVRRDSSSYDKIATMLNVSKVDILFLCDYGQG